MQNHVHPRGPGTTVVPRADCVVCSCVSPRNCSDGRREEGQRLEKTIFTRTYARRRPIKTGRICAFTPPSCDANGPKKVVLNQLLVIPARLRSTESSQPHLTLQDLQSLGSALYKLHEIHFLLGKQGPLDIVSPSFGGIRFVSRSWNLRETPDVTSIGETLHAHWRWVHFLHTSSSTGKQKP